MHPKIGQCVLYTYIFASRKNCDVGQSIKYSKQVTWSESAHFCYITPLIPSSGPILLKKKNIFALLTLVYMSPNIFRGHRQPVVTLEGDLQH